MTEKRFKDQLILFIAQGAFSGRLPFAPGTAGTVVAVLLYWLLIRLPLAWYFILCIPAIIIAVWSADKAEKLLGKKDHPSIVVDEIVGYLIAMAIVPSGWGFVAAGFLLFRAFDILKPFPLGKLQDLHGGWGIVADDIGAGIYTNLVLHASTLFITRF